MLLYSLYPSEYKVFMFLMKFLRNCQLIFEYRIYILFQVYNNEIRTLHNNTIPIICILLAFLVHIKYIIRKYFVRMLSYQ